MRFTRILTLLLTCLLLPLAAAGDDGTTKGRCGAAFSNWQTGTFTIQTGDSSTPILLPVRQLTGGFSSTGHVLVNVDYTCLEHVTLEVYKETPAGWQSIHADAYAPSCGSGTWTSDVEIGIDAGHYLFVLNWYACDGTSGGDKRDLYLVDPPLGI